MLASPSQNATNPAESVPLQSGGLQGEGRGGRVHRLLRVLVGAPPTVSFPLLWSGWAGRVGPTLMESLTLGQYLDTQPNPWALGVRNTPVLQP